MGAEAEGESPAGGLGAVPPDADDIIAIL